MKRLLGFLGVISLVATSTTTVIACSPPDNGNNENGGGDPTPPDFDKVDFESLFPIKNIDEEIEYIHMEGSTQAEKASLNDAYTKLVSKMVKLNEQNIQQVLGSGASSNQLLTMLYSLAEYYWIQENNDYLNLHSSTSFTIIFDVEILLSLAKSEYDKKILKNFQ